MSSPVSPNGCLVVGVPPPLPSLGDSFEGCFGYFWLRRKTRLGKLRHVSLLLAGLGQGGSIRVGGIKPPPPWGQGAVTDVPCPRCLVLELPGLHLLPLGQRNASLGVFQRGTSIAGLRWAAFLQDEPTVPPGMDTCRYGHPLPSSLSAPRRDSTKVSASFKRASASNIDYTELLQHFEKVQNKHLEARHQRAGRAEQLDRRVVL